MPTSTRSAAAPTSPTSSGTSPSQGRKGTVIRTGNDDWSECREVNRPGATTIRSARPPRRTAPMSARLRLVALILAVAPPAGAAEIVSVKKIWDQAPHNAFTRLVRFRGEWFCTFREGSAHVPGRNGTIRVIRSADGDRWESAALLAEANIDLRDPKILTTPDGRLMLLMGGSVYDGMDGAAKRK